MVAGLTAALAERAAAHGRVAIDTEFVSERRYQALLCLARVAVPDPDAPDGVRTEVLDPLGDNPPDPGPLARVLADPEIEVVVHAGRQDIAILRRVWETEVTRVFDTQLAAGRGRRADRRGLSSTLYARAREGARRRGGDRDAARCSARGGGAAGRPVDARARQRGGGEPAQGRRRATRPRAPRRTRSTRRARWRGRRGV